MALMDVKIHSVAACCNNRGIGYKGKLPWRLPKEMKHFLKLTTGNPPEGKQNVVVMGRKTWDSLPKSFKPLKNRYNFVLSRSFNDANINAHAVASSLDELIFLLKSNEWKDKIHEVFNIGGSSIFKLIHDSPYCGKIYLSRIMADFECDIFLPALDAFHLIVSNKCIDEEKVTEESDGTRWKVEVYEK